MCKFVLQPKPIDVQVVSHSYQRYAVWFGGALLASTVRICRLAIILYQFIFVGSIERYYTAVIITDKTNQNYVTDIEFNLTDCPN